MPFKMFWLFLLLFCFLHVGCEKSEVKLDTVVSWSIPANCRQGMFEYAIAGNDVLALVITAATKGKPPAGRLVSVSGPPKGMWWDTVGPNTAYITTAYIRHPDGHKQYVTNRTQLVEFVDGRLRVSEELSEERTIKTFELAAYMRSATENKFASIADLMKFIKKLRQRKTRKVK